MSSARTISHRTLGSKHGFIRRLVSPGDLGEWTRPFVFLVHVHGQIPPGSGFGWHPHSGLATLTYSLNSDAEYEDTAGQKGIVEATGLEWMRAGAGTWHRGSIRPHESTVTAFQLWVALPPELENGPPEGTYIQPADVPLIPLSGLRNGKSAEVGSMRILLGEWQGNQNPIQAPGPILYADVVLQPGTEWQFIPEPNHTVLWALVYEGDAMLDEHTAPNELVVFAPSDAPLHLRSTTGARILLGSAPPHPHPLVLGSYSVHTSAEALRQGEANIVRVRDELRRQGRLQG
jgi:redox-sensitive bicupin YhaK (pirin superfamily)